MSLIDRDALKVALCTDTSVGFYAECADGSEVRFTSREVDKIIDDAPTIDPVRRGRWVNNGDGSYTCTNCGRRMSSAAHGYPHAPCCGAKMDGDAHD